MGKVSATGNNIKLMRIFFNPHAYTFLNLNPNLGDIKFFRESKRCLSQLIKIRTSDLISNGTLKSKVSIDFLLGFETTQLEFFNLSRTTRALISSINTLYVSPNHFPTSFNSIFFSKSKGTTKFRKHFTYTLSNTHHTTRANSMNIQLEPDDHLLADFFFHTIHTSCLKHEIRVNLLRYLNNSLKTKDRTSHFLENVDQRCSFCLTHPNLVPARETLNHIILSCPALENIRNSFLNILSCPLKNTKTLIIGSQAHETNLRTLDNILIAIYIHTIYKHTFQKHILTHERAFNVLKSMVESACNICPKISRAVARAREKNPSEFYYSIEIT